VETVCERAAIVFEVPNWYLKSCHSCCVQKVFGESLNIATDRAIQGFCLDAVKSRKVSVNNHALIAHNPDRDLRLGHGLLGA